MADNRGDLTSRASIALNRVGGLFRRGEAEPTHEAATVETKTEDEVAKETTAKDTTAIAKNEATGLSVDVTRHEEMLFELMEANQAKVDRKVTQSLGAAEALLTQMEGVRKASALISGLILVTIRDKKLYPDGMKWSQYKTSLHERGIKNISTLAREEKIGDAYSLYGHELIERGFRERGDVTKLADLNKAVVTHNRRAAIKNFFDMDTLEFQMWAHGRGTKIAGDKGTEITYSERGISYQGHDVITFEQIRAIAESGKLEEFRKFVTQLRRS